MPETKTPLWLTAALDQRIAQVLDKFSAEKELLRSMDVVMLTLTEPSELQDIDTWERSCDHCGRFMGDEIYTGTMVREVQGLRLMITVGVCEICMDLP